MKILAIMCVRDEDKHLDRSLKNLIDEGIDVHLVDNDSHDQTIAIANRFLGRGLLDISRLPWQGYYSLSDQLAIKADLIERYSSYDWIIHIDADEWLCPSAEFMSLREAILVADARGFNCINFHEIAFIPMPKQDFVGTNYTNLMSHYYFFQPHFPRLMRVWKRKDHLSWGNSGGHMLTGDIRLFPITLFLRHYIVLSEKHAIQKYGSRSFDEKEIRIGWHFNRINLSEEMLKIRTRSSIFQMEDTKINVFDLSRPETQHFWHWR